MELRREVVDLLVNRLNKPQESTPPPLNAISPTSSPIREKGGKAKYCKCFKSSLPLNFHFP